LLVCTIHKQRRGPSQTAHLCRTARQAHACPRPALRNSSEALVIGSSTRRACSPGEQLPAPNGVAAPGHHAHAALGACVLQSRQSVLESRRVQPQPEPPVDRRAPATRSLAAAARRARAVRSRLRARALYALSRRCHGCSRRWRRRGSGQRGSLRVHPWPRRPRGARSRLCSGSGRREVKQRARRTQRAPGVLARPVQHEAQLRQARGGRAACGAQAPCLRPAAARPNHSLVRAPGRNARCGSWSAQTYEARYLAPSASTLKYCQ